VKDARMTPSRSRTPGVFPFRNLNPTGYLLRIPPSYTYPLSLNISGKPRSLAERRPGTGRAARSLVLRAADKITPSIFFDTGFRLRGAQSPPPPRTRPRANRANARLRWLREARLTASVHRAGARAGLTRAWRRVRGAQP
jgi:hypothetical protein